MNAITPLNRLSSHAQSSLFGAPRQRDTARGLFAQLLTEASAYGVTQELIDRSLSRVSPHELSEALRALMGDPSALERVARDSYFHPNGFLKLQLLINDDAKVRLHYWPASMLPAEENLHNHRWRLASKVMLGALRSDLYRQAEAGEAGAETLALRLYRKRRGAHGAEGERFGERAVKRRATLIRYAGEAYCMDTDTLHRIVHTGGSATLTLMVQSAPLFTSNHMLSQPDVHDPELRPDRLQSVDQLTALLTEITALLDAER